MTIDYLDHLERESARFVETLRTTPAGSRVPTCPDWDADDLLWHLGEVQWFWGEIVRGGLIEAADVEKLETTKPPRPPDRDRLLDFFETSSSDLHAALASRPPETAAWMWSSDHTVGYIRRRQAHEALIHRLDAELTAGTRTSMDPALSNDGVDEALRMMYGGHPSWGTFAPDPAATLRLRASDTGDTWLVTLGRFVGDSPGEGHVDEDDIGIADTDPGSNVAATVSATAVDLNCYLWHRPTEKLVERMGDGVVLDTFEAIIAPGLN